MTTKEKLIFFLEKQGIKKIEFYKKTGFSNGFLDSGKHMGSEKLKIIAESYPQLNLDWLILDQGEMNKLDNNLNKDCAETTNIISTQLIETQKIVIEYKDKEIVELKKEIAALKKLLAAKANIEHTVKESITQLSDDVK